MSLEPIIQSEVNQKNKYCIHMYMGSRKMVLMNLLAWQQWRGRHSGHGGWERRRWDEWREYQRNIHTTYVKQIASGDLLSDSGLCDELEGWDGLGGEREIKEGGDMCVPMADSC